MTSLSDTRDVEYKYNIILAGRVGVGKTSLYHRVIYDAFPEEPRSPSGGYENGLERGVYLTQVNGDEVRVRALQT